MRAALAKVRQFVRRSGFDIVRYPGPFIGPAAQYAQLMTEFGVSLLLDVGANEGQFVREIRTAGWRGRVISYEPLSEAFAVLRQHAARDGRWQAFRVALGSTQATAEIHIAANSQSSSLLPMLGAHLDAAPESAYIGTETVDVVPLDDVLVGEVADSDRLCLKLDCQGYEGPVLDGAAETLDRTVVVVMELSLVDLYEGGMRFDEAVARMRDAGFVLAGLAPVFSDPATKELLQVDGCFVALPDRPPGGDRSSGTMKWT